jgi:hypothetical protein
MRQIHSINFKLRTYFNRELKREPQELFNQEEDNDITTQVTTQSEVNPTAEELAQIEAEIQEGEI